MSHDRLLFAAAKKVIYISGYKMNIVIQSILGPGINQKGVQQRVTTQSSARSTFKTRGAYLSRTEGVLALSSGFIQGRLKLADEVI